jgi:hypothetical protein
MEKIVSIIPKIVRDAEVSELLAEVLASDDVKNNGFTGAAILLVKDADECKVEINITGLNGLEFVAVLEIAKRLALENMGF